jgi:predicted kinase
MFTKKDRILYIPIGLPGCGKTYNRKIDALIICKDDLRFMLLNQQQTERDFYVDKTNKESNETGIGKITLEDYIDQAVKFMFMNLVRTNYNIYLDGTNLSAGSRRWYIQHAKMFGYKIHFIVYVCDAKAIIINRNRERQVPEKVIEYMMENRDELTEYEKEIAEVIEVIQ